MFKKNPKRTLILMLLCVCCANNFQSVYAQVTGPQKIKWIKVSALHQWFSNGGSEIEYGRRSRSQLATDQLDGLNWPGEYTINKGVNVGKSLWIGTTNFTEPPGSTVSGKTYPYKVVCSGRLFMYLNSEIWPEEITLIGRTDHPNVYVDDIRASDLDFNDELDKIDPSLSADRMIVNKFHTTIGISVTRKVLAFTQQYHNNYFISEYVFKNTGIIDNKGKTLNPPRTLPGVVFHFQHRYGFAGESYLQGWSPNGAPWGLNAINDATGQNPNDPKFEFRAVWSYYGPHSAAPNVTEDIGFPRHANGDILAGTNFAGVVVLHVDKLPQGPAHSLSSQDTTDDTSQPFTTQWMGSDRDAQPVDQYDEASMTLKYGFMTKGHPAQTHAEVIGKDAVTGWPTGFANNPSALLLDPGGYSAAQGFGPYTLQPGDSIRIVVAEAVAGIMQDRDFVKTLARKWFTNTGPFPLPGGGTTTDRNTYKNAWVFTGKDSLFATFRRAIANFKSGYQIPQPPPPPSEFKVNSGGDKITLSWSGNAESWPTFNGYDVYRAEGRADTTYKLIFTCGKNNAVNIFEDRNARRGFNYFYYIQTKDNSSVPLVSSKFYTKTTREAFLRRPAGTNFSDIRIVPNPFNLKSRALQFGTDTPDRLAFYGIPGYCVIKIYTETGDLIETIDHSNGSGDELWHSLTSSRQIVVSGLYIAYFEVTKDINDSVTGKLLFRKGENTFRKFIVIR